MSVERNEAPAWIAEKRRKFAARAKVWNYAFLLTMILHFAPVLTLFSQRPRNSPLNKPAWIVWIAAMLLNLVLQPLARSRRNDAAGLALQVAMTRFEVSETPHPEYFKEADRRVTNLFSRPLKSPLKSTS